MHAYDSKGRFLNRGVLHRSLRRLGVPDPRPAGDDGSPEYVVWIIDDDERCWKLDAAKGECVEVLADELPDKVRRFLA